MCQGMKTEKETTKKQQCIFQKKPEYKEIIPSYDYYYYYSFNSYQKQKTTEINEKKIYYYYILLYYENRFLKLL